MSSELPHLFMCSSLLWVEWVEHLKPANLTQVPMEIGAVVAVVTLSSSRVRAQLCLGHLRVGGGGCGGRAFQPTADGVQVGVGFGLLPAAISVLPALLQHLGTLC